MFVSLVLVAMTLAVAQARTRQCIPSDLNSVCGCADPSQTADNCFAESPGRVVVMDGYTVCDIDGSTQICNTDEQTGWVMGLYSFIAPPTISTNPAEESSCCVPCTKTTLPCPESSLAFPTGPSDGLCAVITGEPVSGSQITITEWQVINTVSGAPGDLNTGWKGVFSLVDFIVLGGVISKMTLQNAASNTVNLERTDDCTYNLRFRLATRKRQSEEGTVVVVGGPAALGVTGGALGDPHLRSPTGIKYDFDGQANGIYSLFIAPQFQVNMLLAAHGPKTRFMTQIGIAFSDLALKFDAFHLTLNPAQRAQLAKLGGRAFSRSRASLTLELCSGHEVTLSVHHTTTAPVMNYFNVEVVTPGCLDAFGGALGQTYTCKHVVEDVPFVWNHVDEESFRVPSLTHHSGGMSSTAPCDNAAFEGQSSMLGSLDH